MLFGRDAERARIGTLVDGARASRGGALVLRGAPGIGKTALLRDARAQAADMQVLAAGGVESESELPFAALHRLLLPALDHLGELPGAQAAALRGALGLGERSADERFVVFAACVSLLSELSARRPVLCVVDDAHWLDGPSADGLQFVARRVADERIAMLFGARDEKDSRFAPPDLETLKLTGIDERAAARLLRHGAAVAPGPELERRLLDKAAGNALALLELPAALTIDQLSGRDPVPYELPLTQELERVFLERVRRLPEPTQRLVALAAVDDTESVGVLAQAMAASGLALSELAAAERAGLLAVTGPRVTFHHPLVRSAVYDAMTAVERAELHRVFAAVLEGDDAQADRRAWHLAAASLEPDRVALEALVAAARRADGRSAHASAAKALARAADLAAEPALRGDLRVRAGSQAALAGRAQEAEHLAMQAAPLVEDPLARAEIARLRGLAETLRGNWRAAHRRLLDAALEVGPRSPAKAAELLTHASEAGRDGGDQAVLRELCEAATRLAELPGARSHVAVSLLSGLHAVIQGETDRGRSLIAAGLEAARGEHAPRTLILASAGATWMGEHRRAEELLDAAVDGARRHGALADLALALSIRAPQLLIAQQLDAAASAAAEPVRLSRELGYVNLVSLPLSVVAVVAAVRGRAGEAEAAAAETERLGAELEQLSAVVAAGWARALLELGHGRWEDAFRHFGALPEPDPDFRNSPLIVLMTAPDRVEAAARSGHLDQAREALESFEAWASHAGAAWPTPVILGCRSLLADGDETTALLEGALAEREHARPLDRARLELMMGEHLRRLRRRVDARPHLRAALAEFGRLHAAPWAERARAELRASGETARRRDASTAGELTPQEFQVGQLVAEGLSNKEVAARLFLSPRTIDAHLRSVFVKLGVTSRTRLARMPQFGDSADATIAGARDRGDHAHS